MSETLRRNIDRLRQTLEEAANHESTLDRAVDLVADAFSAGRKLLACGNGGSATDAAHLTAEFVCRYERDRRALPAVTLTMNGGDITAIANDYGYDRVFARQVEALGGPGDVLLAMSTSGNSPNIIAALEQARQQRLLTIALLGRDGGKARGLAEVELLVTGPDTARIQETHKLLIHTLVEDVERRLFS
jgi:D-sedoheptulose 7-phosphate isomerase